MMDKISEGKRVFDVEIKALEKMRDALDNTFVTILDLITGCTGKVVITGMGKPGHIAAKLAATFASLGTPAFRLHPAEAMHGDLGMVSSNDIVIAISFSGESDEIIRILPNIKMIGAKIIGITANHDSTLAQASDVVQILPEFEEACSLGLAPTSSTTAELVYGDALAVVASNIYGFREIDFGKYHPAGSLGKKLLLRVGDLMLSGDKNSVVNIRSTIKDTIVEISKKEIGMVSIVDDDGLLMGIITSGDLRRGMENHENIFDVSITEIMTAEPYCATQNEMAVDILRTMSAHNYGAVPIINDRKILIGAIRIHDIIRAGIVNNLDYQKDSV